MEGQRLEKTRGCPRGRSPKELPEPRCELLEGLARRLSGIFGKVESSLRHLVHVGAACLDQPSTSLLFPVSPHPSLSQGRGLRRGGILSGRTCEAWPPEREQQKGSQTPLKQCSMFPLFCGHWTPRGASRPLDWGLTHPNAEVESPIAMLFESMKT